MRIRKVQDWVKANIARFPSDQPAVQKLITQFEKLKKELMNGIEVCGGTCELCRLLCLRPKHHDGAHNCTTDHRCIQLCAWDGKVTCGFSYVEFAPEIKHSKLIAILGLAMMEGICTYFAYGIATRCELMFIFYW